MLALKLKLLNGYYNKFLLDKNFFLQRIYKWKCPLTLLRRIGIDKVTINLVL